MRLTASRSASRDVLVLDYYSARSGYATLDGSAAGQSNPITASFGSYFPHPPPPNKGSNPVLPGARRNILFVDGHVETRRATPEDQILVANWKWPVQ